MKGMTNPTFAYDKIDNQEAAKLRYLEGELTKSRKRVAAEIVEHGKILRCAQEVLANHGDGVFSAWLDSVGISRRSAYNAMDAFTAFGDCANLHNLEVSAMYELAKNDDAKKRALKLADKGVRITHGMAKAIIEDIAEKATFERQRIGRGSRTDITPQADPVPTIEPPVAALDVATVTDETPADKCPNCAAVKWTPDDDGGYACGKCHHPYGEPVGDVDAKRINEARSLAVKYAEAMMRAIDDLNHLVPNRAKHDSTHGWYTQIWESIKAWK